MLYNDFITCHDTAMKNFGQIIQYKNIVCYGHIHSVNRDVCEFVIGEGTYKSNIVINESCIIVSNYFKEELDDLHIIDMDKIVSVKYLFVHKK